MYGKASVSVLNEIILIMMNIKMKKRPHKYGKNRLRPDMDTNILNIMSEYLSTMMHT